MSDAISEKDAAGKKASLHPTAVPAAPVKTWHFLNFATTTAATTFLNAPPAQVAGEVSANARNRTITSSLWPGIVPSVLIVGPGLRITYGTGSVTARIARISKITPPTDRVRTRRFTGSA